MSEWVNRVHTGDAIEQLAELPESSVHMCMTSPPYFGLRDYGVEGQIGLEESLDAYIQNLVDVGEELRRVLRDDGSWWLNLGDSYDSDKQKQLVPHRVAIALQEVGWVVRNDVTWYKLNPMPSSVKDRLNTCTEQIFHLTPEPDYWYDLDAIREPHAEASKERVESGTSFTMKGAGDNPHNNLRADIPADEGLHPSGKNPGDVFGVATKPFPDAHFAVYPPELCETPIKASCPPEVCKACGTPYDREIDETPLRERDVEDVDRRQAKQALERYQASDLTVEHLEAVRAVGFGDGDHGDASQGSMGRVNDRQQKLAEEAKFILGGYFREFVASPDREDAGFMQACDCEINETEPGIVLDPFAGAGTTCLVAKEHGRRFVGVELNPEYADMARARIGIDVHDPSHVTDDEAQTSALDYL